MRRQEQKTKPARTWVQRLGRSLLLLGILIASLFFYSKYQAARRFAGYEQVVRLIKAGRLLPDTYGDIRLPARWKWLTKNGHVYQCKDPTAGLVLLFPTEVETNLVDWGNGKVVDNPLVAGYVYCSGPLPKDGWFSFPGMENVQIVESQGLAAHWVYAEPFYS